MINLEGWSPRRIVTWVTIQPKTIDELRAVRDPEARVKAADAYIHNGTEKLKEARRLRDEAIRALVALHGPSEAARRAGVSLSTVKLIKGRP